MTKLKEAVLIIAQVLDLIIGDNTPSSKVLEQYPFLVIYA